MRIWLDMDGTIADFYGVKNWLHYLETENARPYKIAKPIYDMTSLIETLSLLKQNGYEIGVVSWLSKTGSAEFMQRIAKAKMEWLYAQKLVTLLDEIIIAPYGKNKAELCERFGGGILVDDEKPNRDNWTLGKTINANENIIDELMKLI